jgi:hypothetical protein
MLHHVQHRGSIDCPNAGILQLPPFVIIGELLGPSPLQFSTLRWNTLPYHPPPWLWPPRLIGNAKVYPDSLLFSLMTSSQDRSLLPLRRINSPACHHDLRTSVEPCWLAESALEQWY